MTPERLRHSLAVATKMKEIATDNPEYKLTPDAAFVLGFLHDIGYDFCDDKSKHAKVGGGILKAQCYKYWKEVSFHGDPEKANYSKPLILLNIADMTTGPNGEDFTLAERAKDIETQYGKNSRQIKDFVALAKKIGFSKEDIY